MLHIVAVYMSALAYGGPEEGGWWYSTGELIRAVAAFKSKDKAYDYCLRLNEKLRSTLNRGRRAKSSVLSNGVYEAHVYEGCAPKHFPEIRPHYE